MLKLRGGVAAPATGAVVFGDDFVIADWAEDGGAYNLSFQHNLGSLSVVIQVYDTAGNNVTMVNAEKVDANNVKISVPNAGSRFDGYITVVGGE